MPTDAKFVIEKKPNGCPVRNGSIPVGRDPTLIGKLPKWVRLKASRAVFDRRGEIVCVSERGKAVPEGIGIP